MSSQQACELCGEGLEAPIIWRDGEAVPVDNILVDPQTKGRAHEPCWKAVDEPSFEAVAWLLWRLREGPRTGEGLLVGQYL